MSADRSTRERMMLVTRRLVAARGVDGVPVRDILAAAQVKNGGAIHYYFGSKDELIGELLAHGAKRIDERRVCMLDELEAADPAPGVHKVLEVLVASSIGVSRAPKGEDSYIRFALRVRDTHPALYDGAIGGRHDAGLRRAVALLRRSLGGLADAEFDLRLAMALDLIFAILARREAFLVDGVGEARWGAASVPDALVDAAAAILGASARSMY